MGSRALRRLLVGIGEAQSFDLAYLNVIRSAQLVDVVAATRTIVDLDEFRSAYYAQVAERSASPLSRVVGRIEAPRMRRAEAQIIERVDRYLVSSPVDVVPGDERARLVRSPHQMPEVGDRQSDHRDEMIFVGRMSYSANVEAVEWFANKVWPDLARRRPEMTWSVVGADPVRSIRALSSQGIAVTGRVPSVAEFYRRCAVAIVPVTLATGVQMKLIEALYIGAPVVASRLAADQAGVVDGVHCLTADTPEEWVSAVERVLSDPVAAAHVARSGQAWARANYESGVISAALDAVINEVSWAD